MREYRLSFVCATIFWALLLASPVTAAELDLQLTANGDSRWYDYFSDVFAQADGGPLYPGGAGQNDGFYQESLLPAFVTLGAGTNVFPLGTDFGVAGTVTVDDSAVTGSGIELAPITGLSIDFDSFVADDDAVTNAGYATAFSGISGSVTYTNGVPTSIDLDSTVTFSYDYSSFGAGILDFVGDFEIVAGSFDLSVDAPTYPSPFGTIEFEWDVTGSAAALTPPPAVPFAGSVGLALLTASVGAAGIARARLARRRV
jgi:hypothetical protein